MYGLSSAHPGLAQAPAPLFLLIVPLAFVSIAYGLRGGVGFGLVIVALGAAWSLQHGFPGGAASLSSRAATAVLIGALLGWFSDSRQALTRELAQERALSLDLIATASFDGFFTQVNPAFTRVLGYTAAELLSTPILEFIHPDDRDATTGAITAQTNEGREVIAFQNRYRAKDGTFRWLEWSSRPDPKRRALIAVARDITDRKALEDHERRYKKHLERMVSERTAQLDDARRETVARLALAAEYHDDETQHHTARVGRTAALIATRLGLNEHDVGVIREAALLHDVGKVGVVDAVLMKPGRLSAGEFEQVKQHAEIGARILSGSTSEVLIAAEEIAHFHHERWDGEGYPYGLSGDAIPLFARIVAVADVFDALTHSRHYKKARSVAEAVDEIERLSERQFDPAIVDAFVEIVSRQLIDIRDSPAVSLAPPIENKRRAVQ